MTRLKIPADKQTWNTEQRLKHVMRRLGWRGPELMRFGSENPKRGYRRLVKVKSEDAENGL